MILSPIEQSIKRKIEAVGKPLKDWDIQINYGIKTGCNEAFIIDEAKRAEILSNCQSDDERKRTEAIIRPILRGRDIRRYGYDWAGLYIIGTFPALKLDIESYPSLKQYFLDFGYDRLKQTGDKGARKKTSNQWFETQDSISYWEEFEKPKIVWIELSDESKFTLSANEIPLNTVFFMTGDNLPYLLAFLNSRVILWYFKRCLGSSSGVGTNRWLKFTIEKLPIPEVCTTLASLSDLGLKAPSFSMEIAIENIICSFYDLTLEERDLLEINRSN